MTQPTLCPPIIGLLVARTQQDGSSALCEVYRATQRDAVSGQPWAENFGVWYFQDARRTASEFLGFYAEETHAVEHARRRLHHARG